MTEEIKEILDKFSNRKQGTLLQAIRELKEQDVKHACVTTEENINKLLNYITNLQKENEQLRTELNSHKLKNEKATSLIKRLQKQYGYVLDDLLFLLLQGADE